MNMKMKIEIEKIETEFVKQNEKVFITTIELNKFLNKHYVRDIQNLKCSSNFKLNHFFYLSEPKMYLIDREGFVFLIDQYRKNPNVNEFKKRYFEQIKNKFKEIEKQTGNLFSPIQGVEIEKNYENIGIKALMQDIEIESKEEKSKKDIIEEKKDIKSINITISLNKTHAGILKAIRKFSEKICSKHFVLDTYINKRGRKFPMYNMDQTGYNLLKEKHSSVKCARKLKELITKNIEFAELVEKVEIKTEITKDIEIVEYNGQQYTTSLNMAKELDILHWKVLGKIRQLKCSDEFKITHFKISEYTGESNKKSPIYLMDKEGWSFLIRSYRGQEGGKYFNTFKNKFNKIIENKPLEVQIKTQDNEVEIIEKDGKLYTTSLNIAKVFNKLHKIILANIKKIPKDFIDLHFRLSEYRIKRKFPMYLIDQEGVRFLVTKFKEKKYTKQKLEYINEMTRLMNTKNEKVDIEKVSNVESEKKEIEVIKKDGKLTTTSLNVAEVFERPHKDILNSIKSLSCSQEFIERNFSLNEYKDSIGRSLPMYIMTRDGWSFLVMGFTGEKAAQFKEAYINEFNRMEEELIKTTNISTHIDFSLSPAMQQLQALQQTTFLMIEQQGYIEKLQDQEVEFKKKQDEAGVMIEFLAQGIKEVKEYVDKIAITVLEVKKAQLQIANVFKNLYQG